MSHGELREPEAAEQGRPGEALRRGRLAPGVRLVLHAEAVVVLQGEEGEDSHVKVNQEAVKCSEGHSLIFDA